MRHAVPPSDDHAFTEIDQVLSRAGEVTSPDEDEMPPAPARRRTVLLSLGFALAVLLLSGVIGYTSAFFAVDRSAEHTDGRVGVLEKDLQQRRSAAAEQNANRDAQIAELRRLVCVFADHSQPRDQGVEEIRAKYGCTGAPAPSPSASPAAGPPAGPPGIASTGTRRDGGPGGPGVGGSRPTNATPQPKTSAPTRQVQPPPAGNPGGDAGCVDLPLLPKICL